MLSHAWSSLALAVGLLATGSSQAALRWHADLDQAKRAALERGKDLLINFTGTEWCHACAEFQRDVLQKPAFESIADEFVLVELKFPATDEDLPEPLRAKYVGWREHYRVEAFPIIVLADTGGRPYAITGHLGVVADEYVLHIENLKRCGARRDAALRRAARSDGTEKAAHLDAALAAVQEACDGELAQKSGDPVVHYYRPEIEQIFALDESNTLGLREKYRQMLDSEAERREIAELFEQLGRTQREEGFDAAIQFVDAQLAQTKSDVLRDRLRISRLVCLERSDRHSEALVYARELAADKSYSPEQQRRIRERIAFNLAQLDRIDDALAVYDELASEASDDPQLALRYIWRKASMLSSANRPDDEIRAWGAARRLTKQGTSDWLDVEVLRARALIRAGRSAEAAEAFEAVLQEKALAAKERVIVLAELAAALRNAGRADAAIENASSAEELLAEIGSEIDRAVVTFVRKKLEIARTDEQQSPADRTERR